MTVDGRGRRAGQDFRHEIEDLTATDPGRASFARFDAFRRRKQRNQRIGAGSSPAPSPSSRSCWSPRPSRMPSGTSQGLRSRAAGSSTATGMRAHNVPTGTRCPPTDRAGETSTSQRHVRSGSRTRAGSFSRTTRRSALARRCVRRSSNPTARAFVHWTRRRTRSSTWDAATRPPTAAGSPSKGSVRTVMRKSTASTRSAPRTAVISSGSIRGPVSPPRYSPDGTLLSYFDSKQGVSPTGSGALFVIPATGGDRVRITPWGFAFDDHEWSPDGRWIAFQRPYGQLYLVRPDGSDLHQIPVELPAGAGALNPSWSPDGEWIVFSLQGPDAAGISMVRIDGTGLRDVVSGAGAQLQSPDWAAQSTSP